MYFDFHNKIIFQHLFKTGGHSIYEALASMRQVDQEILNKWNQDNTYRSQGNALGFDIGNHHITFDQFHVIWPKINYQEYTKFCFIRNTYECIVAGYKHCQQASYYSNYPEHMREQFSRNYTFEKHVRDIWGAEFTQWEYMCFQGRFIMDFVGRFDHLQEDFDRFCAENGLPARVLNKHNTAEGRKYIIPEMVERQNQHYSLWYTDELLEYVNRRAKPEIEQFGFKFDDRR